MDDCRHRYTGLVKRWEIVASRKVGAMNEHKHEQLSDFALLLGEIFLLIIATVGLFGSCLWVVYVTCGL